MCNIRLLSKEIIMRSNNSFAPKPRVDHTHTVMVHENDQRRLNTFFRHELALYNRLIEAFESRTRAFPAQISEITATQIQLFGTLAAAGLSIQAVLDDPSVLPTKLEYLRPQIVSSNNRGVLPSHVQFVFDSVLKQQLVVIPQTKQAMIQAVCEFYKDQAAVLMAPVNQADMCYRSTAINLIKLDAQTKRHAQIPRSVIRIVYNHEQDCTELFTPLNAQPLVIPGVNINNRQGWTTLVLRQEPGRYVTEQTPWLAEFRNTQNKYLIRLTDTGSRRTNNDVSVNSQAA